LIRKTLDERSAEFMIILDDVSITDISFGAEFSKSIEEKQIALQ
jgi:regulator of protease activity HflC (stomatin/prohibitin superfamily)